MEKIKPKENKIKKTIANAAEKVVIETAVIVLNAAGLKSTADEFKEIKRK